MTIPTLVMGIDPGSEKTAFCTIYENLQPAESGILENEKLFDRFNGFTVGPGFPKVVPETIAMEYIISRKWAGREVSDAAIWSGLFSGAHHARSCKSNTFWVSRSRQIHHLTRKKSGGDKEIRDALIKRFAPDAWHRCHSGEIKRTAMIREAKDTWFNTDGHAFHDDIWQAYGIAVTVMDILRGDKDGLLKRFV